MRNYFPLFVVGFLFLLSCGDDPVTCDQNSFVNDINAEITDLNNAIQAYGTEQTSDNCNAWKDAAQNYLDAVERYDSCDGLDQAQFQDALQQARDAVNSIPC